MKVAIDARAFGWPGLGRYTRSLLASLSRTPVGHEYVVLLPRADRAEFETFRRQHLLHDRFSVVAVEGEYYSVKEQTVFWRQAEAVKADLFHFTHFNVPMLFRKPYVVTIHDATRFLFPGQIQQSLLKQFVYELVFARAVVRARAVICVSKTTREELERLPLKLPRPSVIYEGVDEQFFQPVSATHKAKVRALIGSRDPFVLYVGVWMSHKNLPRLLTAFSQVREHMPQLKLVLIGKPRPRYINMVKLVQRFGITKHVVFPGFVPEELLPALYAESVCLLLPSLYEGFGLPALEAAAAGAPVITSNVAGSAEIMEGAARLVNPEYVPGIVRALKHIVTDSAVRERLIAQGKERAQQFSWDDCARATLEVYAKAQKSERTPLR
ncbi:MAG: glycosyltransferase family 1 protein [Patescibacteria group bacterium]